MGSSYKIDEYVLYNINEYEYISQENQVDKCVGIHKTSKNIS